MSEDRPLGFAVETGRPGDIVKVFFGMGRRCERYRVEESVTFGMMVENGKHGIVPWKSASARVATDDEKKTMLAHAANQTPEIKRSRVRKLRPGVLDA